MRTCQSYSDKELLKRLRESDIQAFDEIYERYSKVLYIAAKSSLRNAAYAADIVQEVFLSLWQRREISNIEILESYLHQTTRYMVLHMIKQGKTEADFYKRLYDVSVGILDEDPVLFKELQALIPEMIASLPADQQMIFQMHREQNMTYHEIARHLNISVKTVEKKMSLSLRQLRLLMGRTGPLLILEWFLR